jgi:hypothetical protein
MRKYLHEIGGSITLHNTMIRPKLQQHDQSIMERAIKMDLTLIQQRRINSVRMYLGIMYISEICNIDGDSLVTGIDDNTHNQEYYTTRLQKPKQKKPNKRSWSLWKRVIHSFTTDNKKLTTHLGKWTKKHSNAGTWKSYRSEDNKYWTKYKRHGTQLRLIEDRIELADFTPASGTPTQIRTFLNGTLYGDMTATTMTAPETGTTYKPGPMVSITTGMGTGTTRRCTLLHDKRWTTRSVLYSGRSRQTRSLNMCIRWFSHIPRHELRLDIGNI